jgi:N-acetylmuramoyl-L-alanine amidase
VLLTIPEGTTLDITAAQGNWYQTAFQNKNGWVSADYVNIVMAYKQGEITASGGLNLRTGPSTASEILTTIPEGARVSLTEVGSEWHKVAYRGAIGWIYGEYVSVLPVSSDAGPEDMDLSPNGRVCILGGIGAVSAGVQDIIEGKTASKYPDNLKEFAALPTSLGATDPLAYNPATEVLIDPFQGMPAQALLGKKIFIDPGHGGEDTGAIGPTHI